jgi:hypothetical protein
MNLLFLSPSSVVVQGGGRPSVAIRVYFLCRLVILHQSHHSLTVMRMAMAMVLTARKIPILFIASVNICS